MSGFSIRNAILSQLRGFLQRSSLLPQGEPPRLRKLSQRSEENLAGIHPNPVKVMRAAIADSPAEFTVTGGVRTAAGQKALYAQGRTAPGSIVTNADGVKNKSSRQVKSDSYGYAVDLYPIKFMTVLFFISPAVFAAGMAAAVLKYGIPESVSESYYLLPSKIRLPIFYWWTVLMAVRPVIFRLRIAADRL